jgi:hypothetical protein
MFDCACNIFVVLTRGFLLPKQMLYQAELRPNLNRQGAGGPGIVAASHPSATESSSMPWCPDPVSYPHTSGDYNLLMSGGENGSRPGRAPTATQAVEYATLEWVDWFNHRRLLEPIGHVPPAEFEQEYYRQQAGQV